MNHQLTPVPEEAGRILLVDDDATNLDVLRETLGARATTSSWPALAKKR